MLTTNTITETKTSVSPFTMLQNTTLYRMTKILLPIYLFLSLIGLIIASKDDTAIPAYVNLLFGAIYSLYAIYHLIKYLFASISLNSSDIEIKYYEFCLLFASSILIALVTIVEWVIIFRFKLFDLSSYNYKSVDLWTDLITFYLYCSATIFIISAIGMVISRLALRKSN